jgi:hypothetical protein
MSTKNELDILFEEAYKDYVIEWNLENPPFGGPYLMQMLSESEFAYMCKIQPEYFGKKHNVILGKQAMSWEEQVQWVMRNTDVELENLYIVEEIAKETTPKNFYTLTYKDKTAIYRYE